MKKSALTRNIRCVRLIGGVGRGIVLGLVEVIRGGAAEMLIIKLKYIKVKILLKVIKS